MCDQRILPCRKIDNRLRRCSFPRNLTVYAPNGKLRARWIGLDFKRAFAADETKRRRIERSLATEIHRRFNGLITGTHDPKVVLARLQVCERGRTFLRVIAQ